MPLLVKNSRSCVGKFAAWKEQISSVLEVVLTVEVTARWPLSDSSGDGSSTPPNSCDTTSTPATETATVDTIGPCVTRSVAGSPLLGSGCGCACGRKMYAPLRVVT